MLFNLFSKRQKRLRGEYPDVFQYDKLPKGLRVQVVHIMGDAIGNDSYSHDHVERLFTEIHRGIAREYGLFTLSEMQSNRDAVLEYFLETDNVEHALDVIEVVFAAIENYCSQAHYWNFAKPKVKAAAAVEELNARFKENGVGYEYNSGEIIRIDSALLHAEAVKPVLTLLRQKGYEGPNDEFLSAHEHYRHGRHKECLVDCLKSLESTMKVLCKKKRITFQPTDTVQKLIQACIDGGVIPSFLTTQFTSLRALLESGVPTVRNKLGGHGQGEAPVEVPQYVASYALHLTASNILFLASAATV